MGFPTPEHLPQTASPMVSWRGVDYSRSVAWSCSRLSRKMPQCFARIVVALFSRQHLTDTRKKPMRCKRKQKWSCNTINGWFGPKACGVYGKGVRGSFFFGQEFSAYATKHFLVLDDRHKHNACMSTIICMDLCACGSFSVSGRPIIRCLLSLELTSRIHPLEKLIDKRIRGKVVSTTFVRRSGLRCGLPEGDTPLTPIHQCQLSALCVLWVWKLSCA